MLIRIPSRPYRSFAHYALWYRSHYGRYLSRALPDNKYFCKTCDGSGVVHRIEDRDVYEGYKLAPLHPCSAGCDKGVVDESVVRHLYKAEIDRWRAEHARASALNRLQKSALAKIRRQLTTEEIKSLGLDKYKMTHK